MTHFAKIKSYLLELRYPIVSENTEEELVVISEESSGIKNLVIDCEEPLLIFEQLILELRSAEADIFKKLLQINRELVHGAFVLDASGTKVIFRDTLQIENLDLNEFEGSIKALELAMAEYGPILLEFAERRS